MLRATRELLAALARVNREVPAVALGIMDASLPAAQQVEFGDRLIELGRAVQRHARLEGSGLDVIDVMPSRTALPPSGGEGTAS